MDEDVGVRVTRLRRRLSVEQKDDVKSPATPSKKRGGKLAAVPQLDNISENSAVSSPKRITRRSLARDSIASVEEKLPTPSKRITRISSVTSQGSIAADKLGSLDSPRATRASRRNSFAGSDTENPITPIRRSKVLQESGDSQGKLTPGNKKLLKETKMQEIIPEESEKSTPVPAQEDLPTKDITDSPSKSTSPRKSPRLNLTTAESINDTVHEVLSPSALNVNSSVKKSSRKKTDSLSNTPMSPSAVNVNVSIEKSSRKKNDSLSNTPMCSSISGVSKGSNKLLVSKFNKSLSSGPDITDSISKKVRTKSLTNIDKETMDISFLSDNENRKSKVDKKKKKSVSVDTSLIALGSGDSTNTKIESDAQACSTTAFKIDDDKENSVDTEIILNFPVSRKKRLSEGYSSPNSKEVKDLATSPTKRKSLQLLAEKDQPDKTMASIFDISCKHVPSVEHKDDLINKSNVNNKIYSTIYIDDSDTNTDATPKPNDKCEITENNIVGAGDQCVPMIVVNDVLCKSQEEVTDSKAECEIEDSEIVSKVLKNATESHGKNSKISNHLELSSTSLKQIGKEDLLKSVLINDSCEPMDIDVTIPENSSIIENSKINKSINTSKTLFSKSLVKSSQSILDHCGKSHISTGMIKEHEKSGSGDKSTIILSLNKDNISANITSKSLNDANNSNVNRNKRNNNSINGTPNGTPIKPKTLQNLGMKTSTPVNVQTLENNISKNESDQPVKSKKAIKQYNNSLKETNSSSSSNSKTLESSSQEEDNSFLANEAEDAGEDYQSGDSQNEDEKEYLEQNEIVEKGETLDSQDELTSDDSEYEKDSFLVSSNEEDNELLSGSGDDLSSSDNELSMSARSKKKFNDRKKKEQKSASKEMYDARHGNNSDDQDDSEIIVKKPKNKSRLRLDSSMESSNYNIPVENEKEISAIFNNSSLRNKDPLSITISNEIKKEVQSPRTVMNKSSIVKEDLDEVCLDENASLFVQASETLDPLTMNDGSDDSDSSTDNEKIVEHYDNVLNSLNELHKKGDLKSEIGLNKSQGQDKRKQKQSNNPLIDQLNLTQRSCSSTEKTKKLYNQTSFQESNINMECNTNTPSQKTPKGKKVKQSSFSEKNTTDKDCHIGQFNLTAGGKGKGVENICTNDESSSDAIDFKLLFSNDEDSKESNVKNSEQETEEYIPLRKSIGKINLLDEVDNSSIQAKQRLDVSALEISAVENSESRQKKRKRSESKSANVSLTIASQRMQEAEPENQEVLDNTVLDVSRTSVQGSKKKKKKSFSHAANSSNLTDLLPTTQDDSSVQAKQRLDVSALEISAVETSEGRKKKRKRSESKSANVSLTIASQTMQEDKPVETQEVLDNTVLDVSRTSVEGQKKKKKKSFNQAANNSSLTDLLPTAQEDSHIGSQEIDQSLMDVSCTSLEGRKKKKKKSLNQAANCSLTTTQDNLPINTNESEFTLDVTSSEKKKKKLVNQTNTSTSTPLHQTQDGSSTEKPEGRKRKRSNFENEIFETASATVPKGTSVPASKKTKKRKEKEGNVGLNLQASFPILRLPPAFLSRLDDGEVQQKKKKLKPAAITSTSTFHVEEAKKRRNKPSTYLEESILLSANTLLPTRAPGVKNKLKRPKTLPSVPSAPTSVAGCTTQFMVNVIENTWKPVSQAVGIVDFKTLKLYGNKIKRTDSDVIQRRQKLLKYCKF